MVNTRAEMADPPEQSDHTSVQQQIPDISSTAAAKANKVGNKHHRSARAIHPAGIPFAFFLVPPIRCSLRFKGGDGDHRNAVVPQVAITSTGDYCQQ